MMIQPINSINKNINSINFRNSAQTAPPKALPKESSDVIQFLQAKDKKDKQNQLIQLGGAVLILAGTFAFLPKIIKSSTEKKLKIDAKELTNDFFNLKDDKQIPTLETCKSIDKKLKTFLQNQVDLSKATARDLEATGMPKSANRLIMYGAPGSGKSFFAKIFAKTLDAEYKEIMYANFNSKWAGEGNERLAAIFEDILKVAKKNPEKKYVVNFNEIDSIVMPIEDIAASGRNGGGHWMSKLEERSTFLNYVDKITETTPNVTLIGTTNLSPKNNGLDGAAMSRFKNIIEVSYPEKECLKEAIKAHLKEFDAGKEFMDKNKEELENFAQLMSDKKCSYRDLNNIIDSSKNHYLRDYLKDKNSKYKYDYLKQALDDIGLTDGEISGIAKG